MVETKKTETKEKKTSLGKKHEGYGYKYTDIGQINALIDSWGERYEQYIETFDGQDYIMTIKIDADGNRSTPLKGCKVLEENILQGKNNPAQNLGAAITYARRYSLLMAYGLSTEDDDAQSLTVDQQSKMITKQQTEQKADEQLPATQSQVEAVVKLYKPEEINAMMQRKGYEDIHQFTLQEMSTLIKARTKD